MGKGFIKGTVFGAIGGVIAALALSPKSGKENQREVKRVVHESYEELTDLMHGIGETLEEKTNAVKGAVKELKGEAHDESKSLVKRAEVLAQDLKIAKAKLAESGIHTRDEALKSGRKLLDESAAVGKELEKLAEKLAMSAKEKVTEVAKEPKAASAAKSAAKTGKEKK